MDAPLEDSIRRSNRSGRRGRPQRRQNAVTDRWDHDEYERETAQRGPRTTRSPRDNIRDATRRLSIQERLGLRTAAPMRKPGVILTITNLDFNVTEKDMRDVFHEFGPILKTKLLINAVGRSLGIAEV
eukprot:TRINITY_DN40_c0_g1_i1.p2 TRINITY_DN40_c0_g1~~TRINITY_DN40_c0_g1_i1.p2  ORF type:complete len:128 (-),score=30.38 TRINITY_DN40_c0_g1_i1:1517-1900(-)